MHASLVFNVGEQTLFYALSISMVKIVKPEWQIQNKQKLHSVLYIFLTRPVSTRQGIGSLEPSLPQDRHTGSLELALLHRTAILGPLSEHCCTGPPYWVPWASIVAQDRHTGPLEASITRHPTIYIPLELHEPLQRLVIHSQLQQVLFFAGAMEIKCKCLRQVRLIV